MPKVPAVAPALLGALVWAPVGGFAQQAPKPWQQGVSYRIEASLDEGTDRLSGRARVWYRNESPDTLTTFSLHLYLNAFRPGSAWARRDLEHGVRTFTDLGPEDHAFERLGRVAVDGRDAPVSHPFAPDSTIARVALPAPLLPGGEVVVEYDWVARLSTVPRRQGRRGRHYDFAQWYPRVVVYDLEGWREHPLYRQGEFYGEFATYDVTLEVDEDQVMGATGVPVSGDPGWGGVAVDGTTAIELQRDWYGTADGPPCVVRDGVRTCGITPRRTLAPGEPLGLLSAEAELGRKHVRWRAEDVHHFAWSTDPEYTYEQGRWGDVQIRVLYRPGDEESWGGGVAVERTATALAWLEDLFGPYPYPQVTNLHRLEGGGTEFPMLIMDGSASQGLILHEVGHIYTHGILANNEWYEGWLDEGFSSFQTAWFNEARGGGRAQWLRSELRVIDLELRGKAEPVTLQAERYAEMGIYSAMVYTKGSLVFWMLRERVGEDVMRRILRRFYHRYRFRHVDQHAFQSVAEEVSGLDLDDFFGQWLHGNGLPDYALAGVEVEPQGGRWRTRVTIARRGDVRMDVPVWLEGPDASADTIVPGDALRAVHEIRTLFEPRRVILDPGRVTMDWNALNDRWGGGLLERGGYAAGLDRPFSALPVLRDAAPLRFLPLAWGHDAGGMSAGLQIRTSYLRGLRRALVRIGSPGFEALDKGESSTHQDPGSFYFRLDDPILGRRPSLGTGVELFAGEGRGFLRVQVGRDLSPRPLSGPRRSLRGWVQGAAVYDPAYVVAGRWSFSRHQWVEAGIGFSEARGSALRWGLEGTVGAASEAGAYLRARAEFEAAAGRPTGPRAVVRGFLGGITAYAGGRWDGFAAPRERQHFLAGGDPLATISNPWSRSSGALLDLEGWAPGGAGLLGYHPGLAFQHLGSLTVDVSVPLGTLPMGSGLDVRVRAFGGAAYGARPTAGGGSPAGLTRELRGALGPWEHLFASAGAGVEIGWRDSPVRVRVDAPFVVRDPALAATERSDRVRARLAVAVLGYR